MFDWIGSLRVAEKSRHRLVLGLARATRLAGLAMIAIGVLVATWFAAISLWLAAIPGFLIVLGAVVATLKRELVFDREEGVLRMSQSALGISNSSVVPLFHLRAVVIIARPARMGSRFHSGTGFVAYVDRRVGDAIFLDEARRSAGLFRMAEAIADLAELRLEYEAAPVIDETA